MNRLLCSLNVVALVTLATFHFMGDSNNQSAQVSVQPQPHLVQQAPRMAIQTIPSMTSSAMLANDSEATTPETTQRWVF